MKKLSDYLHLYLGCYINRAGRIEKIDYSLLIYTDANNLWEHTKPLLRPLSDMTEEEVVTLIYKRSNIYLNVRFVEFWMNKVRFEFEYKSSSRRRTDDQSFDELDSGQFLYLLKQGFDLFNLIPDGLAIDKTLNAV